MMQPPCRMLMLRISSNYSLYVNGVVPKPEAEGAFTPPPAGTCCWRN